MRSYSLKLRNEHELDHSILPVKVWYGEHVYPLRDIPRPRRDPGTDLADPLETPVKGVLEDEHVRLGREGPGHAEGQVVGLRSAVGERMNKFLLTITQPRK